MHKNGPCCPLVPSSVDLSINQGKQVALRSAAACPYHHGGVH
jgi:hypothetical protein